jgi:CcmD family protein
MNYLFWAYAVVWIGLFVYLRMLLRRTRALEEDLRRHGGRTP